MLDRGEGPHAGSPARRDPGAGRFDACGRDDAVRLGFGPVRRARRAGDRRASAADASAASAAAGQHARRRRLRHGGFLLRLTRTSVPAGELTVFFRNYDVSDHNLWIASPGGSVVEQISDTVGEGGGGSRTLPVSAGAWRLFCSLPDHGVMTRTLTVTP